MGGPCGTCEVEENTYRIVVGKAEGNRPLRRARREWGYNIKIYLKRVEFGGGRGIDTSGPRYEHVVGCC